MKHNRLLVLLTLTVLSFSACNRYNFDNFQGIQTEGEWLLPLASATYSIMDMMERFQMDSLIACDADGHLWYHYYYENRNAIKGSNLLKFNDMNLEQTLSFENPVPYALPYPIDTSITLSQQVVLQSEHVHVLSAIMKSGQLRWSFDSNVVELQQVIVRCAEIMDAEGNGMECVYNPSNGAVSFNLSGWNYETDAFNTLNFEYELHFVLPQGLSAPEINFDVQLDATNLALKEMVGRMDPYSHKNQIDTTFNLFPDNVFGSLEVKDVSISLNVKNSFGLMSRMIIDTALVSGPGFAPFSVFDPMPQIVDFGYTPSYETVFQQTMSGSVCAHGGQALATSEFILNYDGSTETVAVADTCSIGARVNADIPFAFRFDDVHYLDTVNMRLSAIESPEWVKKLTMEMEIQSTIPLNISGKFYMYDSENDRITDTLVNGKTTIAASFDGQPTLSTAIIELTGDRLDKVMHSDRIILDLSLDTDSHEAVFNVDQALHFYVKAKVEYDGVVSFNH